MLLLGTYRWLTICHYHVFAGFLTDLDVMVKCYRDKAFAETTKTTNASHLRSYLKFCSQADVSTLNINQYDLACYTVTLSKRLKYNSIKQYLNVVRLLHAEAGLPNPLKDNWFTESVLRGVRRTLGDT